MVKEEERVEDALFGQAKPEAAIEASAAVIEEGSASLAESL